MLNIISYELTFMKLDLQTCHVILSNSSNVVEFFFKLWIYDIVIKT